jgi:hypothetical protein
MKVRYSCVFLGFFFWVSLASADVTVNGQVWVKTSVEDKMGYLTGFYDGLREGSLPYEAMKKDIKKSTYEFSPRSMPTIFQKKQALAMSLRPSTNFMRTIECSGSL